MTDASRSRDDTRSTIVDAAAQLLHEHGPIALTTRGVAERAGVQAPTIYRLFGDKDGLLDAVAEHVLATHVATKFAMVATASAEDVDPLDDLRAGWEMQIDFGVTHPTLFALLTDPQRGQLSPAARAGHAILASRVHRVATSGRLRVGETRAVDLLRSAGTGVVLTILSTPSDHRDPGLADSMFDAVLAQILTDAPDRSDGGPLASAVAFRAVAPGLETLSDAERRLVVEWLDRVITAS